MRQRGHLAGFGTVKILLVVLAIVIIGAASWFVYQHNRTKLTNAAVGTQAVSQQPAATATTPAETVQYLTIKEWGVKIPLSKEIADAYYVPGVGSVGADGITNQMYLGLKSLDSVGCKADGSNHGQDSALAMIFRALPTEVDPGSNKLYTQEYPNGVTIGKYYYAYAGFNNSNISSCKASQTIIQSTGSAFASAAKGMVSATAAN